MATRGRPRIYSDGLTSQRRWQLKKRIEGKCPICGKTAVGYYCKKHRAANTAQYAKRLETQR